MAPGSYRTCDNLTIERHGEHADALPNIYTFCGALMSCVATQGCSQKTTPISETCDQSICDMPGPVYGDTEQRINALKAHNAPPVPIKTLLAALVFVVGGVYIVATDPFASDDGGAADDGTSDDSTGLYIGLAVLVVGVLVALKALLPQLCGTYTLFILTDRKVVLVVVYFDEFLSFMYALVYRRLIEINKTA